MTEATTSLTRAGLLVAYGAGGPVLASGIAVGAYGADVETTSTVMQSTAIAFSAYAGMPEAQSVVVKPFDPNAMPTEFSPAQFMNAINPQIGVPVGRPLDPLSPVQHVDTFGNEIYYRSLSEEHLEQLLQTDELPASTETSISPKLSYASGYRGTTVQLVVEPGTSASLQEIGIANNVAAARQLPDLSTKTGLWMDTNAQFKVEGGQMTTQLGQGAALDIFNNNLILYRLVGKAGS